MTRGQLREAVKNAVCGSMACDARCKPEMKIKACGLAADAALAVALPALREHYAKLSEDVEYDCCGHCARDIRADEGPK